jgi:hypothetical protein
MRDWNPNKKGAVAELEIQLAARRAGIGVYLPSVEHMRADMLFEIGEELLRVQVKWGRLERGGDVLVVHLSGNRCTSRGYIRTMYSHNDIDLVAVYAGEIDRSFLLPIEMCAKRHALQLRLKPTRNNQRACINLADDFDFQGAVAQLARAPDRQSGGRGFESPQLHSLDTGTEALAIGSELFGKQVGYWMQRAAGGEEISVTFRGRPRVRLVPISPPLLKAA